MVENFDITTTEESTSSSQPINSCTCEYIPKMKHRKPKGKKKTWKALKKTEAERDELLYLNGRLSHENEMMKRTIMLAVAANRRKLDDGLSEDALRLLPPKKGRGW